MQHSVTDALSKISWLMHTWDPRLTNWDPKLASWDPNLANSDPNLANQDPNLANWDPELVSWDLYLANSLLPGFDPLCPAFSNLIFTGGVQQGQLVVPVLVVVNHATHIIIDHKLDLKCVLQDMALGIKV